MNFVNTTDVLYNLISGFIHATGSGFVQNNLYLYPNIVEVRRRCMTQAELAEQIGISQQEISRYERGEIKAPINYLIDLASCCGVSVDYILGRKAPVDCLSDDEARIVELYSSLSPENKTKAEERMRTLLELQD